MKKLSVVAVTSVIALAACDGLRDALTAHVDVAARAESQELTVQRLADMMARSQVPIRKEVAQSVADLWVNYQLVARAAADGDSLSDPALIDEVMWPVYTQSRTSKWYQVVSQTWQPDTSNIEQKFNDGVLLSARHILFQVPAGQAAAGSDSVRRRAESVLRQTTSANFAAMAKQHGSDGTKDVGGDLGVFRPDQMVPEFSQAVSALKPGEIGPLVKTQFGYHIIRRNTFAESEPAFRAQYAQVLRSQMDSNYVVSVEKAGNIQIRPNLARVVKQVAADPEAHKGDRTVIATSVMGDFTAASVVRWIGAFQQPEQIRTQLQQEPDSVMPLFVKNLIRNELFLRQADSAGIELDSTEIASVRQAFRGLVANVWAGLRVAPTMLADSAKTERERQAMAAARVEAYLDRLLQQQEGYVEVPSPLATAVRERYDGRVNQSGLIRAVEAAQRLRAASDSARTAGQPKSAVPVPGDTGGARPPQ